MKGTVEWELVKFGIESKADEIQRFFSGAEGLVALSIFPDI